MAEQEKREFTVKMADGKEVVFTTRRPTSKESQEAEFEYSKAFNKAIMAGIVPEQRFISIMAENGVWTSENDQEIVEQRNKVANLEAELKEAAADSKKTKAMLLQVARAKLYAMRRGKSDLLAHTAEAKAESAQRDFIVSKVTERNGVPVWRKTEDFINEADGNIVFRATFEHLSLRDGIDPNFMSNNPENEYLKPEEKPAAEATPATAPAEAPPAAAPEKPAEPAAVQAGGLDLGAQATAQNKA